MLEYQISVAVDGRFLFRTDWDSDKDRVQRTAVKLHDTPDFQLSINRRDPSQERVPYTTLMQGA